MRRLTWVVGAVVLVAGVLGAGPARAEQSKACSSGLPQSAYSTTEFTARLSVQIAPCRDGKRPATVVVVLSVSRCQPVLGCGFAKTARKQCRGTTGTCTAVLHYPHDAVEVASYQIETNAVGFSGDQASVTTISGRSAAPCVSVVAATLPTC